MHNPTSEHLGHLLLATSGLLSLAALGALLYASFLIALRTIGLRQAAELVNTGNTDQAIDLYLRLHRRFPGHAKTSATLAELLIRQNRLDGEATSVFERAYADRPGDGRLLRALSECYVRAGSLSPKARDVYLKSLDVSKSANRCNT